jgi:hypothetical protein
MIPSKPSLASGRTSKQRHKTLFISVHENLMHSPLLSSTLHPPGRKDFVHSIHQASRHQKAQTNIGSALAHCPFEGRNLLLSRSDS